MWYESFISSPWHPKAHFNNMDAPWVSAWLSNHMPGNVWDEIPYLFPNVSGCTVEALE